MILADVRIESKTRRTDRLFTYLVPETLQERVHPGALVHVPFGRGDRSHMALVVAVREQEEADFALKSILGLPEGESPISEEGMALAEYMVHHLLSDQTSAIQTVLPPGSGGLFRPKLESYYHLLPAGGKAEIAERAKKQKAVIEALRRGEWERRALMAQTGATSQTLHTLEDQGLIARTSRRVSRRKSKHRPGYQKQTLTPAQQRVYDRILEKNGKYLICGVTGSGKTEIYLQLVEHALEAGKEAIILVPEISLTPQTIARFEGRFGSEVAILHSRLSVAERHEEWEKIVRGEVHIAIGARSAIFAPFEHLGIIIIDEEHEGSYTSEKNPKYHASDIAAFRCDWHHATLVLGSATPSVETLYHVQTGDLVRLDLPERVNGRPLPEMRIMDMREELKANNRSMLSRGLYQAMKEALKRGEQSILFLNKRGHTSFVFCRSCGYVYRCDACDVAMTYHKHRDRLICHYCGREKPMQRLCPQCGSDAIREFGAGTEHLEEEVQHIFPQARIRRADADTMRKKGSYENLYADMLDGRIDILVGTQMIAKGFDFPNVTVVGIVSADVTLNLPDLRAAERTFQLVTQVAGRAGRAERPGMVFIQTYHPEHYALQAAAQYDLDAFYEQEMQYRMENGYPPVRRELYVQFSGPDRRCTLEKAREVRGFLDTVPQRESLFLEGPTPSVIERINGRYRFALLLRSDEGRALEDIGRILIDRFPSTPDLWILVTLDPQSVY